MAMPRTPVIIVVLAVGAVVAFIGMNDYVGYISWGISPSALYIGIALIIAGAVMAHLDLYRHRELFEHYESAVELRETMGAVPDDDYCIDVSGQTYEIPETEYLDLTCTEYQETEE